MHEKYRMFYPSFVYRESTKEYIGKTIMGFIPIALSGWIKSLDEIYSPYMQIGPKVESLRDRGLSHKINLNLQPIVWMRSKVNLSSESAYKLSCTNSGLIVLTAEDPV